MVKQRNVWSDNVSWRTRRLSNSTKYPLHAPMTTTSRTRRSITTKRMDPREHENWARQQRQFSLVGHNMCIEKMEQFISGESKKIFRISSHTLLIGLTVSGKYAWQEEEIRADSSTVLIRQEHFCTSELFRDIQDALLLILRYRTMW